MVSDNCGIRQQLIYARVAVTHTHPPSRDDHPGRATIGRRSPDARSGVRSGQISVFLASAAAFNVRSSYLPYLRLDCMIFVRLFYAGILQSAKSQD
jgi:hypothetical protein